MSASSAMIPQHVAIIMDGNGRWAERLGRPRIFGHIRGCSRVREIIREADRLGVKALTLYAFSSENWGRPSDEVNVLMRLLYKWLVRERREILQKNIRFRAIGAIEKLPMIVRQMVFETEALSKDHTGLQVSLALSYGSRQEILRSTQRLCQKVLEGKLTLDAMSEADFANELYTAEIGDPDLLIRTSGEQRISNFLLWQLAYAEMYFTEKMWPDFRAQDLQSAVESFSTRQRRFGLTSHQAQRVPQLFK